VSTLAPIAEQHISTETHEAKRAEYLRTLFEIDDPWIQSFVRFASDGRIRSMRKSCAIPNLLKARWSGGHYDLSKDIDDENITRWVIDEIDSVTKAKEEYLGSISNSPEVLNLKAAISDIIYPREQRREERPYTYLRAKVTTEQELVSEGYNIEELIKDHDPEKKYYRKLNEVLMRSDPFNKAKKFDRDKIHSDLQILLNTGFNELLRDMTEINPLRLVHLVYDQHGLSDIQTAPLTTNSRFHVERWVDLNGNAACTIIILDNDPNRKQYELASKQFPGQPSSHMGWMPFNFLDELLESQDIVNDDEKMKKYISLQIRLHLLEIIQETMRYLGGSKVNNFQNLQERITIRDTTYDPSVFERLADTKMLMRYPFFQAEYNSQWISGTEVEGYMQAKILISKDKKLDYYFSEDELNKEMEFSRSHLDSILGNLGLFTRGLPEFLFFESPSIPGVLPRELMLQLRRINTCFVTGDLRSLHGSRYLTTYPDDIEPDFQKYELQTKDQKLGTLHIEQFIPEEIGYDNGVRAARLFLPQFANLLSLKVMDQERNIVNTNDYTIEYDQLNGFYRIKFSDKINLQAVKYDANFTPGDVIYDRSVDLDYAKVQDQVKWLEENQFDQVADNLERFLQTHNQINSAQLSAIIEDSLSYTYEDHGDPEEVQCSGTAKLTENLLNRTLPDNSGLKFYSSRLLTLSYARKVPLRKTASLDGHSDTRASYIDEEGRVHLLVHDATPSRKSKKHTEKKIDLQTGPLPGSDFGIAEKLELDVSEIYGQKLEEWQNVLSQIARLDLSPQNTPPFVDIKNTYEKIGNGSTEIRALRKIMPEDNTKQIQQQILFPVTRLQIILDNLRSRSIDELTNDPEFVQASIANMDYILNEEAQLVENYKRFKTARKRDPKFEAYMSPPNYPNEMHFTQLLRLARNVKDFLQEYAVVNEEYEDLVAETESDLNR